MSLLIPTVRKVCLCVCVCVCVCGGGGGGGGGGWVYCTLVCVDDVSYQFLHCREDLVHSRVLQFVVGHVHHTAAGESVSIPVRSLTPIQE